MRRSLSKFALAPVALVAIAACSGGDGGSASEPAPPSAPSLTRESGGRATAIVSQPVTALVGQRLAHVLPRGGVSALSVTTIPNARCELRGEGEALDAREHLSVYSDDEGIARVHLRHADPSVDHAALVLDCDDGAGRTSTHPIDVSVVEGASSQPPARFSKAGRRVLPALDVSPESLSESEVAARGYPPRPDREKAPDQYAKWLELASSSATVVEPHLMSTPERFHRNVILDGAGNSSIWSGYVITSQAVVYGEIFGAWPVPAVAAQSGFYYLDYSTYWVGIDGYGTSDVVQAGTSQNTQTIFGIQASTYGAWTEWYPLTSQTVSNFPVNPGDDIEVWVWVANAANTWSATGGNGWFLVWNATQNVQTEVTTVIPAGVTFTGHTAEWIMERPTVNGTITSLANYGTAQMTDSWACDFSYGTHYFGSDTSTQLTMMNGTDELSSVAPVTTRAMTFTWHNNN